MNDTLNVRLFTCSAAVWQIKKLGRNKYSSESYQEDAGRNMFLHMKEKEDDRQTKC